MTNILFSEHFRTSIEWTRGNLIDDLMALTPEQAATRTSPDAESPIEIVEHCVAVGWRIAALLGGPPPPSGAPVHAAESSTSTREDAVEKLDATTALLIQAVESVGEDRWGEKVQGPFGPTTLASVAALASLHTMYHVGQLNLLDRMHGHLEMNWAVPPRLAPAS